MSKGTKKADIWEYFKNNRSITALECWEHFKYGRLAGYICLWMKNGIEIKKKTETGNNGTHWTRYFITKKEARRAEREGLVFGEVR